MADPAGEAERDERLWLKRHLTFTANGEGMFDVNDLMPEDVAHVRAALDHIAGAAYADETRRAHHTRIADAFVEVCKAYNSGSVNGLLMPEGADHRPVRNRGRARRSTGRDHRCQCHSVG